MPDTEELLERLFSHVDAVERPRAKELIEAYVQAREAPLREALMLADELCSAIENAELDIGGSRPIAAILRDLGPATDAARAALQRKEAQP